MPRLHAHVRQQLACTAYCCTAVSSILGQAHNSNCYPELAAMLQACWMSSTGHIPPSWHQHCCTGLLDVEHRVAIAILKLRLCLQVTLVLSTEWQIAILTLHLCYRPVGRRT